jgi:enoyl-CoA hydratase
VTTVADLPAYESILLERERALTWIVLNRPDKLNAMNATLLDEFADALRLLESDEQTRVVAIRGAGRAFSTGYDIERGEGPHEEVDIVEDYVVHADYIRRFMQIWDHPKPVLAAVHGYCLAGATQLCTFADMTIVADDAVIGWPMLPVGGGYISPLWVPLVGPKRAKQMSFVAGSRITGTTAADWGWANYAVPADDLMADVRKLAADIAKIPSSVLRMKKVAINRVADVMGFRNIAPMGAETDALLHYSSAIAEMTGSIREHGLKKAIALFQGEPQQAS